MRAMSKGLGMAAVASLLALTSVAVPAQAEFPEKPITIIYPWAPGDPVDTVLRTFGEVASKKLGQPFVINNVKGAGGKKSMAEGAKADADGYTLLNNWVAPQIAGKLFDPSLPYDNASYAPVAGVMAIPFTVTVNKAHEANSIQEFVAWAQERGKPVNYGVCAAQSVPRLVGEQFMRSAKVDFNPIPNNTGCAGDNMKGLLDGSLDVAVGVVPLDKKFPVKHLSLITDEPHPLAPDLPTAKSQGITIGWGNAALGWGGLVAPRETPPEVLKILQESAAETIKSEEFNSKLDELGLRAMVKYVPPEEFEKLWTDSMVLLKPYVEALKK